jgi:hypothetical protein
VLPEDKGLAKFCVVFWLVFVTVMIMTDILEGRI